MKQLKTADLIPVRLALSKEQGGVCPICKGSVVSDACVDHDHKTGRIRGALCRNCNGLEGRINRLATRGKRTLSTLTWLKNLTEYLEYYSNHPRPYLHPLHKTEDQKREKRNAAARKRRAALKAGR